MTFTTYAAGTTFGLDIILRLILSLLSGAVVGYERMLRHKSAGIRTHAMVALGSAIFAIASKYGFLDIVFLEGASVDTSRVAANIVTGVCFLGAGMIFVRGKSISGLTTAAGIWTVSAIGMVFGCGMYSLGIVSTFLIAVIQYVLQKPLIKLEGASLTDYSCVLNSWDRLDEFREELFKLDVNTRFTEITKRTDGTLLVKFVLRPDKFKNADIYTFMSKFEYIVSISD